MKRIPFILIVFSLLLTLRSNGVSAGEPTIPSAAGGFILNSSIEDYSIEGHANYLNEVILTDIEGFRKGFITYGTCQNPGKILRIKLKYENRSQDLFNDLLQHYKEKFGDKPIFSGDPFGNVKSWKWSFTNDQGHVITLVLQHNSRDTDESIGNMVKLSMPGLMDEERLCFNKLHDKDSNSSKKQSSGKENLNWDLLIPK